MLTKDDPAAAIEVYAKFPVPENPTFDDAYIHGEFVRLLMKLEKYDDPRLTANMIAYGRVLGIGRQHTGNDIVFKDISTTFIY